MEMIVENFDMRIICVELTSQLRPCPKICARIPNGILGFLVQIFNLSTVTENNVDLCIPEKCAVLTGISWLL
jgi:hypothetical protein